MESNWDGETLDGWDTDTLVMQSAAGLSWCLSQEIYKKDNTAARHPDNFNAFFIRKVLSLTTEALKALQRQGTGGY